jgi:hypothetical protein
MDALYPIVLYCIKQTDPRTSGIAPNQSAFASDRVLVKNARQ